MSTWACSRSGRATRIPGFDEGLIGLLPTLEDHACSLGRRGGFISRLKEGTWLGHVSEHVAIELQSLAGTEVHLGKTRGAGTRANTTSSTSTAKRRSGWRRAVWQWRWSTTSWLLRSLRSTSSDALDGLILLAERRLSDRQPAH